MQQQMAAAAIAFYSLCCVCAHGREEEEEDREASASYANGWRETERESVLIFLACVIPSYLAFDMKTGPGSVHSTSSSRNNDNNQ